MAAVLTLEVATPKGLALQTEANAVQAPSVNGEFGVLPGHLPLLAALRCGLLKYTAGNATHIAAVGPGFVEAEPDKVLLLTDLFALPEDIDVDAVNEELKEAHAALNKHFEDRKSAEINDETLLGLELEATELRRHIDWAEARLEAKKLATRN